MIILTEHRHGFFLIKPRKLVNKLVIVTVTNTGCIKLYSYAAAAAAKIGALLRTLRLRVLAFDCQNHVRAFQNKKIHFLTV